MGTVPQLTVECGFVIWVDLDDKSKGEACFFSLILFFYSVMKKEVIIEITASLQCTGLHQDECGALRSSPVKCEKTEKLFCICYFTYCCYFNFIFFFSCVKKIKALQYSILYWAPGDRPEPGMTQ